MRKRVWVWLGILLIPGLMMTASCSKKAVVADPSVLDTMDTGFPARTAATPSQEELARQRALEEERLRQEQLDRQQRERADREQYSVRERFMDEMIHFEFDSAVLTPTAQDILRRKAEFLRNNPGISIIIEGHCDERGTNEYNMALGERRAESVKAYLVNLGISSNRITTVSYGEERPLDPRSNEDAWRKNRRAQFVIR
jgi:peptidoglycan-associated lipoprotein